jgi:serine/threonine protein kinase
VAGFQGTERYTICRRLGSGGFGEVFEAFDHVRQYKVALKVPHEANPLNIYLVKQEFRALADVVHPNLVSLFELHTHGPDWFFTMELVEGSDYHRRLRDDPPQDEPGQTAGNPPEDWEGGAPPTLRTGPEATRPGPLFGHPGSSGATQGAAPPASPGGRRPAGGVAAMAPRRCSPPRDYREVRELTRQLAEGLDALHRAGKLHRDIKPANVLVTGAGRVVLVDFGLAMDLAPAPRAGLGRARVGGTPAYMAPERIEGQAPDEASDWYSVGVMLYRALTGQLPFPGNDLPSVASRMGLEPKAPALLVPGTPQDLSDLCLELLCRRPELRPSGREILWRLSGAAGPQASPARLAPMDPLLVGRREELAGLRRAFAASRQGQAVLVLAQGASGMGKSFLLRRFLWEIQREHPGAVVLAGRCYEQESVPFKALDSLVDALTQHLLGLPRPQLAALLPAHMPHLAKLFPVLHQLEGLAPGPAPAECPDSQELRRLAFAALRRLLNRLGERCPLVLFIDDLQWGDRDSSALLASLFHGPDLPSMLLLACHRTEAGRASPVLREFRELLAEAEVTELNLEALPAPEARQLALELLGPGFADAGERGAWIARESGGSPFFISELSQHAIAAQGCAGDRGGPAAARPQTLDQYIRARVAALPPEGRRILEVVALAGYPVDWEILARTCSLDQPRPELLMLLNGLQAAHFIRTRGQGRRLVETFHDRIREAVARDIPGPRARELHHRLAQVMERSPWPDPQALARHFQHAGETARAADYAERAAELAARALAFEQAAHWFRVALELRAPHEAGRAGLLAKLGGVLADAGLGCEAAQAFQEAARLAPGGESVHLQRRTAEQLFRCGSYDQGLAALEAVLATLGMRSPSSPGRALVSSLWRRALVRLRGLRFVQRREADIPREDLDRIDICWTGAMGLGPIDHIRGGDFQVRALALALKAGEPFRMVRALAHECIYVAHRGSRSRAATERVLAATRALAEQLGEPGPLGRSCIAAGTAALMQGRWKAGMELHERAETLLREQCSGMDYELHISQNHGMVCHWVLGNVRVVEARLAACLRAARDKADLMAVTNLRASVAPYLHLAKDQPERALGELGQVMAGWSVAGFHIQHYHALVAQANIHLYAGEPRKAWDLVTDRWPPLRRSLLLRVQTFLITMLELRARTALAVAYGLAAGSPARAVWLRSARADRRAVEREATAYGSALALKLRAQEALAADRPEAAGALLLRAETAFGACDMGLHAMAARLVRCRLEGGAEAEAASARLRDQGVVHPERFARMHVPLPG